MCASWLFVTAMMAFVTVDPARRLDERVETQAGAFARAVTEHHRRLAGLAYALCGDRQLAEDLVAEAYARVWPKWRNRQVDDLGPYLRRAVVNLVHGRRRRKVLERRELERRRVDWREGQHFEGRVEDRDQLWDALMRLPVDQRAAIVLRHLEDLSEEETASVLGVRPGTVKSRLARGLTTLRELLDEGGTDG